MALCAPCSQVLDLDVLLNTQADEIKGKPYLRHHASLPEFRECATRGDCPICVAAWASRDKFDKIGVFEEDLDPYQDRRDIPVMFQFLSVAGDVCPTAARWAVMPESDDEEPVMVGMLHAWTLESDPLSARFQSRPIQQDCSGRATFDQLRTWLDECRRTHSDCDRAEDYKLPTRVIDVGSSTQDPRLVETCGTVGPWAALSYCWGTAPVLTTKLGNVESHKKRIPLDALPLTIRDAVIATRELGLRYIWVDSLCIIQDSDSDWLKEAATMHAVYRHAAVTIGAEASSSSHVGIFNGTNPVRQTITTIPATMTATAGGIQGIISFSEQVPQTSVYDLGPLSERAWVLQEDLLSRRHIRFAPHQIYWRCKTMEATEVDIRGSSLSVRWDVQARLREHVDRDQWFDIVNRFGARQITFAKDRLPAIAAMARVYGSSEWYRDYVAGLWLSHIHNGLLWVTDTPKCTKTSSAPSWSWASVHRPDPEGGRSQWFYTPYVYRVKPAPTWEVLQVSVELVSDDPYGPVVPGAFLSMSGLYLEVCKCRVPSLCFDEFERPPESDCLCDSGIQGGCPMHWVSVIDVAMDTLVGCPGHERVSHTRLAMLYVGKSLLWRPEGNAKEEFAWCLLLEPRGVESYNFTRVGSIALPYGKEDAWKNWRQQVVSIF